MSASQGGADEEGARILKQAPYPVQSLTWGPSHDCEIIT